MSLGKVFRSTSSTRSPFLASSMAVYAPAHRAPTSMASYMAIPPSVRNLMTPTLSASRSSL
jgi:hypothetical protein